MMGGQNTAYRKGYMLERRVKKKLEEMGFFVLRSAGSHQVDLIAFSPQQKVYWIECKLHKKPSRREEEEWRKRAERYGAIYLVITRENLKSIINLLKKECQSATVPQ